MHYKLPYKKQCVTTRSSAIPLLRGMAGGRGVFKFAGIKLYSLILCLIVAGVNGHAQEDNIWAFGNNAGINFNTNPPTPIWTGIKTEEGCASVCNDNGKLLFYTDGTSVWDRNNALMSNGTDLSGAGINITSSTTQGALIVPMPGNIYKYYIFSLGMNELSKKKNKDSIYLGRLYYSIVDMNLNSGLGAVTTKGIMLDSLLTEHMTAASGNACNVWLLVASRSDTIFKAYNIAINGIDPHPVISKRIAGLGSYNGYIGSIDVSPDRSKLAIAQGNLILYDFDADLGKIIQPLILAGVDTITSCTSCDAGYYGVCFSPDNTKLYASARRQLQQFNVSLNNPSDIIASNTFLGLQYYGIIKRGPDGKMYAPNYGTSVLNVINRPNLAGTACQFIINGGSLSSGTTSKYGLNNLGAVFLHTKIHSTTADSILCSGTRVLTAKDTSGRSYIWEDSTLGSTRMVDKPGIYWVRYQVPINTPCMYEIHVDTFKVVFHITTRNINTVTRDSGFCKDTIVMTASNLNSVDYIWGDGFVGRQRTVTQAGNYWVRYRIDSLCENYMDSFIITYPERYYKVSFNADSIVCEGKLVQFNNTSDTVYNSFMWYFGDGDSSVSNDPAHIYTRPGSYQVVLAGTRNNICFDTIKKIVTVDSFYTAPFQVTDSNICTGQANTFVYKTNGNTINSYQWAFGDGTGTFTVNTGTINHTYYVAGMMPVTLSIDQRVCPDISFLDTIYVYTYPLVDLGPDTAICPGQSSIVLTNLHDGSAIDYKMLWNTGDITSNISINAPGQYWLQVNNNGCATTDTVDVRRSCFINVPNVFSPNGDGINDRFFPRNLLSSAITRFHMKIYNRWGQELFETSGIDGSGWDGMFNGTPQPEGVYIYMIEAAFANNKEEKHQGNVTLIR